MTVVAAFDQDGPNSFLKEIRRLVADYARDGSCQQQDVGKWE
jgi:hypothetical protein